MTAEERIAQFLDDHPTGTLKVVVAYASTWGLAWLHSQAPERQVDLLIGNTSLYYFKHGTTKNRQAALQFLKRENATISNQYRFGRSNPRANMIAWLVLGSKPHLLAGSANLSEQSMVHNQELMAEAAERDIGASIEKMKAAFADSTDCRDRLIEYISKTNR